MTNKHEWVGTSGLKQLLVMLVGFIYLLWQWQVMQRKRGSTTPTCKSWIVVVLMQEKRAEVREWDCIRMNKGFLLAWHFWRWYSSSSVSSNSSSEHTSTEGEQPPANTERTQSMQCTIWCMIMTCQYAVIWANAAKNRRVWVYLNQMFKFKLKLWNQIVHYHVFI